MATFIDTARTIADNVIDRAAQQPSGPDERVGIEVRQEEEQAPNDNPLTEPLSQIWDTVSDNMREAMQGWRNAQPVQGQGGYTAYIEPESGQVAFPEEWNNSSHPILKRGIAPEQAIRLAAAEASRSQARAREEATRARDTARRSAANARETGRARAAAARSQIENTESNTASTNVETERISQVPAEVVADNARANATRRAEANSSSDSAASPAVMNAVDQAMTEIPEEMQPAITTDVDEIQAPHGQVYEDSGAAQQGPAGNGNQAAPVFRRRFSARENEGQQNQSNNQAYANNQAYTNNQAYANNQEYQPGQNNANPQNQQQAPAAQAAESALSERELIQQIKETEARDAIRDARRLAGREREQWRRQNPGVPESEFVASDAEAFERSLGSAMVEHWGRPGNPTSDSDPRVIGTDVNVNVPGVTERDETRKWRLLDRVSYMFQMGFFHISSESLEYDDVGMPYVRYSLQVTRIMDRMRDTFGLTGSKGDRTIFRLVIMYCSLSVDRSGQMFNESANEWSMNDDDFVRVCNLIMDSAINNNGNPMVMPHKSEKLGGTDIYPAGVMPRVVAQALVNPNNRTIPVGTRASDLVRMCQDEWTTNTYPRMQARLAKGMKPSKSNLRKKTGEGIQVGPFHFDFYKTEEYKDRLTAQRIVVENFNEALSRLDGMSLEDFSSRYRVDTSMHACLEECKNANKIYARAMNDNYDADMVMRREKAKEDAWERRMQPRRYYTVENPDGSVEISGVKHETSIGAGARLMAAIIRGNALLLNIPIAIGSITEHGIANLQTNITLKAMLGIRSRYRMSSEARERIRSNEFVEAMTAVKLMMELLGPGGCRLFKKENIPYTSDAVIQFARKNYMPDSSSEKMRDFETWISKATNKVMTGDIAFKKSDNINWWLGVVTSNDRRLRRQNQLAQQGQVDRFGIGFTPEELEDMLLHKDPGAFLAEMMGDDAGIDGFLLMRGNNIGNINLVSYNVQQALSRNGVVDGVITMFVDHFPKYGINLIMALVPFSKTITYLLAKRSGNKNIATDSDLAIGGNINEMFIGSDVSLKEDQGLRMNLWYDGIMFARQAIVLPLLAGVIMAMFGYDPPKDKRNLFNPSMWTVGGVEFHLAYWTNDITLWSLPIAHLVAYSLSKDRIEEEDPSLKEYGDIGPELFRNSLYDQLDGNVVLDLVNIFKNWQVDIAELKHMTEDPAYQSDIVTPSSAMLFANEYLLNIANSITPLGPVYRSLANSEVLRGRDANLIAYNKVFDKSDEWHIENNITKYIDDPFEIMLRQNSSKNYILAAILDITRGPGLFGIGGDQSKTGYLWWEMPTRSAGDPLDYIYLDMFKIDYDRREKDEDGNYIETYDEYDQRMAKFLIDYVSQFEHPEQAIREEGIVIPQDIKTVTLRYISDQIDFLNEDLETRKEAGEFAYDQSAYWDAYHKNKREIDAYVDFIYDWLINDDIPEWGESYDINITDWETTFYREVTDENGVVTQQPASPWDYLIGKEGVEMAVIEKGNIPNNLLPFTIVQDWGGYNKETPNYWYDENTDLEFVKQFMDKEIPMGRDKGKKFGDVVFGGEQPAGFAKYTNPDEAVVGHRSWKPHERKVSDEVKELADEIIDSTKKKNDDDGTDNDNGNKSNTSPNWSYFPRSTYGGYSNSSRYSYSNDRPKIYSSNVYNSNTYNTKVYNNTHISNSRISNSKVYNSKAGNVGNIGTPHGSNTKISNSPRQVGSDRASGMQNRNPQSTRNTYLRPGFSTKGSREAYKRQDI